MARGSTSQDAHFARIGIDLGLVGLGFQNLATANDSTIVEGSAATVLGGSANQLIQRDTTTLDTSAVEGET